MYHNRPQQYIMALHKKPHAWALVEGNREYPNLQGMVRFYQMRNGVIVMTELSGLPTPSERCKYPVFGFHIHSGGSCTGNTTDLFADTLTHFDPQGCPHPHHAGDLPPLFGAGGEAFSVVLTDRFTVNEIIGKTIVVHSMPDDFTTQPAGNAGEKIACGVIQW